MSPESPTWRSLPLAGELYGAFHMSTGLEASIVGACMALRTDNDMVGAHCSYAHQLGEGAALGSMLQNPDRETLTYRFDGSAERVRVNPS